MICKASKQRHHKSAVPKKSAEPGSLRLQNFCVKKNREKTSSPLKTFLTRAWTSSLGEEVQIFFFAQKNINGKLKTQSWKFFD
jgi:hypothetical protein